MVSIRNILNLGAIKRLLKFFCLTVKCKKITWTIVLVAALHTVTFSQANRLEDGIAFLKGTEGYSLPVKNADSAIALGSEALQEAMKLNNQPSIAAAYSYIGWGYKHKGQLDSSILFYKRAQETYQLAKNDEGEG